uniref:Tyrosine-protein phosphatase domain-containing protein n=1 Tax=Rhabditophanes sp. KR3021 TaxID=114890 RepID=A0AC35TL78_9BILA
MFVTELGTHWRSCELEHLILFMKQVWFHENLIIGSNKLPTHATVIHGVSGTRRTGAFCILSIVCRQLASKKSCAIVTTSLLVRKYRCNVLRSKAMFATVLLGTLYYAQESYLIRKKDPNYVSAIRLVSSAMLSKDRTDKYGGTDKKKQKTESYK